LVGLLTCKNRRPYDLYCVGADVKPCSIEGVTDGESEDGDCDDVMRAEMKKMVIK